MPQSYDDIIRQMLDMQEMRASPDEVADIDTLMQDPQMMQGVLSGGRKPNTDMMINPQAYTTMDPPVGPRLDRVYRGERYDDTKTTEQRNRTDIDMLEAQRELPRTPTVNPTRRPHDPNRDDIDELFPGYSKTDPTVPSMQRLYRQMPMRPNPQPNETWMEPQEFQRYNVPKQYEQPELDTMQQLMDFYAGGSDI